jgi:uncharacterized protein
MRPIPEHNTVAPTVAAPRQHPPGPAAGLWHAVFWVLLAFATSAPADPDKIPPADALAAVPFAPADVRLLDGPFRHAMEINAEYLLSLEPDRLLSGFREEAGLKPKAAKYGGWESQGIAGHTLGHYLSACSRMYQDTGNRDFRDRVNYLVDQLAECQRANTNGYLAAIPDGKRIFAGIARGEIRAEDFNLNGGWVPWYTLHKELAGLIDACRFCESTQALRVATRLADWAVATTQDLTPAQWQSMLVCEHGGMNESLADLYALTGNTNYLALAGKFYHRAVLDPLAQGDDRLDGLHSNMQIPKTLGAARLYELTGAERYRNIADFFWKRVALHRSCVVGGHGDHEHFFPVRDFERHLTAATCETCCTYNLLKLSQHRFSWSPDARTMDFYERALYNDILASQDPETGMFLYFLSLKPGGFNTYSTPHDSFWCCVGTGMENHSRYNDAIYFHNAQALYVNLFIPSELTWREKHLVLRQETRFPEDDSTRLMLRCDQPVTFALTIRWPGWARSSPTVRVNGQPRPIRGQPGSFFTLDREWRDGDQVEIRLPMDLHTELLPGTTNLIAVLYGPVVLAGDLGTNGMPPSVSARDQTRFLYWPTPPAPAFVADRDSLLQHIQPTDQPLVFRTHDVGRPNDLTLVPLFKIRAQRYAVYWNLFTDAEWKVYEAARAAGIQRQKDLEKRTVDHLQPGDRQSERDHHVQGRQSDPVEALGRPLRHAYDGGWFAYEVAIPTNAPADLLVTYWGGETGNRAFDILVSDRKIATQNLHQDDPGRFWDKSYPLPEEVTRGRTSVTIKFQAHPGNYAGGVFDLRVVKRE